MEYLEKTFRWFGSDFGVSLQDIKQTGATGVVNALHHLPTGEVWSNEAIKERKSEIENNGLKWSVVESVNVSESIKTATGDYKKHINNYIETLHNLANDDIKTVCYNFMPVLDWTRTDLNYILPNGSSTLRFDAIAFAAFELYILKREAAFEEYDHMTKQKAKNYLDALDEESFTKLKNTIMAGLPGTRDVLEMEEFKSHLAKYKNIDAQKLKENLAYFLKAIIPEAEKLGVKMCVHPDDPPYSILGLPRIVSNSSDIKFLLNCYPSYYNGLTFCTGSLGARKENNLVDIFNAFADKVHFLHLRSVQLEKDGSFYEANHLEGSAPMVKVMESIVKEQIRRKHKNSKDVAIPLRADHGHLLLTDVGIKDEFYPGYSTLGRMKGLAELSGLEMGIRNSLVPTLAN